MGEDKVKPEWFLNASIIGAQMNPEIAERIFIAEWNRAARFNRGSGFTIGTDNNDCHRLHIDRRIERGFSFIQLFEDETIDSFYTVVFAGYAGESRQSWDRSEAVGYFSIQISTPDTGHLNHIFIIRILFGFACLDLLFSQFDSLGSLIEPAYGIGVAEVEGDIIVIVRTDRESATSVEASGTIPFGNEWKW